MANVLLSLDDELVARFDAEARRAGISLSDYLERLLSSSRDSSDGGNRPGAAAAIERIRAIAATHSCDEDSTDLIRQERDAGH